MRFHEAVHEVYFDDLDAFRILHNARYVLMFERTIGSFWRHLGWGGPLEPQSNPDQFHLVRANHVEYLKPVVGVGQVRVRVWVEKLGTTSLVFALRCLAMDEDLDYATGTRAIVRVSPETWRPEPWTPAFRRTLEPYIASE
jgi:acyl-CoA thioester hydrolase